MSIPLASATTLPSQITPSSTMEMSLALLLVIVVWFIVAVALGRRIGVFDQKTVVGPERLEADESAWMLLGILFFCFAGANLVAAVIDSMIPTGPHVKPLFLTAIVEGLGFPSVVIVSVVLRRDGLGRLGLCGKQIFRGIALGVGALFLLFPCVWMAEIATEWFINLARLPQPKPHPVLQDLSVSHDPRLITLAIVVAVIVAPFFEELAFRGFLQTILSRLFAWMFGPKASRAQHIPPLLMVDLIPPEQIQPDAPKPQLIPTGAAVRWTAILVTAAAFAAIHREAAFFPPLFVLAVGLGYAYERTGNLWVTITMHALFNACQIVFFLAMVH